MRAKHLLHARLVLDVLLVAFHARLVLDALVVALHTRLVLDALLVVGASSINTNVSFINEDEAEQVAAVVTNTLIQSV